MRGTWLPALVAAGLLTIPAGCDWRHRDEPVDPAVAQSCREEGFDPGTTEYVDCVEELSGSE
ncbi:MAG: hypothetical protein R3322_09000 [Kiloniellales bacterium]|jgi:hypothetical protein|nr:hypothetical protein [Kiloniellales bacterium]